MTEHCLQNKIYYHDTDCGGVVYYSKYLEHLEEGRTEMLITKGINVTEYLVKDFMFVIAHIDVKYKASAHHGDIIKIYSSIDKVGNTSIHFSQTIKRDDTVLVQAQTVWVYVDKKTLKPVPVPDEFRKLI